MKKHILLLFSMIVLLLIIGSIYQYTSSKEDMRKFTPLGKLYDVGEVKLHLYCKGIGSPTIIFEAGWAENSLSWYSIQEQLSKKTRACSYDRVGLGWSDGNGKLISNDQVSMNLNNLLEKANITPPYVLVGHSRGGIYVRNFYLHFPNKVKGMMLLDSTHERGAFRSYKLEKAGWIKQKIQTILAVSLAKVGLIRIMGWTNMEKQSSPLPKNIVKARTALQSLTKTVQAATNEILVMRESLNPATPAPLSLGDLPLTVITAKKGVNKKKTEEEMLNDVLQEELAALSSNSNHIIACKSGHYIMFDEPELVIDEISKLINEIK